MKSFKEYLNEQDVGVTPQTNNVPVSHGGLDSTTITLAKWYAEIEKWRARYAQCNMDWWEAHRAGDEEGMARARKCMDIASHNIQALIAKIEGLDLVPGLPTKPYNPYWKPRPLSPVRKRWYNPWDWIISDGEQGNTDGSGIGGDTV